MGEIRDLPRWIEEHRRQIIADLTEYVSKETPSDDKELLATGLNWIEQWLKARVGEPGHRRIVSNEKHGDTLVLEYPAEDVGADRAVALCHYDTVWPAGTIKKWSPNVDGDRFTGPGAFDMKAGLVQLIWGLKAGKALGLPRPGLTLVLNGDEELGSPASRPIIEEEVLRGGPVLVFEASAGGAVKTARKGVGKFRVEVSGEEAHAGLNPEAGVSAIDEISRIVLKLHAAGALNRGTSVNVGVLSGGTRANVRAGRAIADLDVRVTCDEEAQRIQTFLSELAPHNPRAKITTSGGWARPVMRRSASIGQLFQMAANAATELGFTLSETSVGGASDGNFAAALGIPVLDGLGAVGSGANARSEWISINGMLQRTALAAAILAKLAGTEDVAPLHRVIKQ